MKINLFVDLDSHVSVIRKMSAKGTRPAEIAKMIGLTDPEYGGANRIKAYRRKMNMAVTTNRILKGQWHFPHEKHINQLSFRAKRK